LDVKAPADAVLAALLDQYAPFGPAPLCPEISVFQGRSLIAVWEAAEQIAGAPLPAPFWAYPWAGGSVLARLVLDQPELVREQAVLELGAGGGVVSLAAARAGAATVVANDIDPWATTTVRIAAARQHLNVATLLADLTENPVAADHCDVFLCSDMAYERRMAPKYRSLLQRARNRGARVLVADAGRTYFDTQGLTLLFEGRLDVPIDLEGVTERVARVYELR
jgi:predicted nicotinamide N-methyase